MGDIKHKQWKSNRISFIFSPSREGRIEIRKSSEWWRKEKNKRRWDDFNLVIMDLTWLSMSYSWERKTRSNAVIRIQWWMYNGLWVCAKSVGGILMCLFACECVHICVCECEICQCFKANLLLIITLAQPASQPWAQVGSKRVCVIMWRTIFRCSRKCWMSVAEHTACFPNLTSQCRHYQADFLQQMSVWAEV